MVFNHPYLKDKIIDVKPVEAGQKWKGIVSNYREKENDPFLFKKVVKSFELPLNSASKGGGVAIIMDSVTKSVCPDVMNDAGNPEELTEQEYFEKIIGRSLNPYLPKDTNFWRADSRARVQIRDARLRLDLKSPMDMLKFKNHHHREHHGIHAFNDHFEIHDANQVVNSVSSSIYIDLQLLFLFVEESG